MHCLETIVKRNDEAAVRAWRYADAIEAYDEADRVAYANRDLFKMIDRILVPR